MGLEGLRVQGAGFWGFGLYDVEHVLGLHILIRQDPNHRTDCPIKVLH